MPSNTIKDFWEQKADTYGHPIWLLHLIITIDSLKFRGILKHLEDGRWTPDARMDKRVFYPAVVSRALISFF